VLKGLVFTPCCPFSRICLFRMDTALHQSGSSVIRAPGSDDKVIRVVIGRGCFSLVLPYD
jgi:hypothetical protein